MQQKKNTGMSSPKSIYLIVSIFISFLLIAFFSISPSPQQDLKKQTFKHISAVRAEKKKEVLSYFDKIEKQAKAVSGDREMLSFFSQMQKNNSGQKLEDRIAEHYVFNYNNFYDILFIDSSGFVFHSIKKESDYRKNIFSSENEALKLVKQLKNPASGGFVEYEYYPPSGEAAAFFAVALKEEEKHIGWFVLQFELNRLNAILTRREGLGRTGETYLVNTDKMMLSESRFVADSTVLQLKVDTLAVKKAMHLEEGEEILTDYRGINVFSSFEMFDLFGVSWILIVEIDEDEIVTEHFKKNQDFFILEFVEYLAMQERKESTHLSTTGLRRQKVEMNEFAKSENQSYLVTEGVSTCTAIVISYPEKFAYLAHISPTDEIYLDNGLTKYFLKDHYHDFLSELIARIKYFQVYPYELNKLHFVIVATHSESFAKAVQEILAHDIELASIKFMYNPESISANVGVTPPDYRVQVIWNGEKQMMESSMQVVDLGSILKKIIGYDSGQIGG